MSERDPQIEGLGEFEGEAPPEQPRRAASATFTQQREDRSSGVSLDPAQQSLAEALRITFFILQLGMLALIGLFLLSGAKQIKEAERGVRLTFGKVVEQDVPPGLHLGWPYPIGEFVTVQTGQQSLRLDDSFFPMLSSGQRSRSLDELGAVARFGLVPGTDGSLLTADGNIVHLRPTAVYRRQSPGDFVRNMLPGSEESIVRAAIERAVTQTLATLTLEQVLKQGVGNAAAGEGVSVDAEAGPQSSIAARVRRLAQEMLDAQGSGIVLEEVALRDITPPLSLRSSFAEVQSAQSQAEQRREQADRERRERLSQVAGQAAELILARIDAYEQALELQDENAEDILAQIDLLLLGEPVEIDGQTRRAMVSGETTNLLNGARRYRTEIESRYRSFAQTFAVKLEQYRTNPGLLVTREWTEALTSFFARQSVETNFLPAGMLPELLINRDPDVARERDRIRNEQQLLRTLDQREIARRAAELERRRRQIAEEGR